MDLVELANAIDKGVRELVEENKRLREMINEIRDRSRGEWAVCKCNVCAILRDVLVMTHYYAGCYCNVTGCGGHESDNDGKFLAGCPHMKVLTDCPICYRVAIALDADSTPPSWNWKKGRVRFPPRPQPAYAPVRAL